MDSRHSGNCPAQMTQPGGIATRKFPRSPFGLNPKEVAVFLAEIGAAFDRLNTELARLRAENASLKESSDEVERLRDKVEALRRATVAHQEREASVGRGKAWVELRTELPPLLDDLLVSFLEWRDQLWVSRPSEIPSDDTRIPQP